MDKFIKRIIKKKKNKIEPYNGKDYLICWTLPQSVYSYEMFDVIYEENKNKIRYMIVGMEWSKKKKYPHYQGYIQLFDQIRLTGFKKLMETNKIHMEKQKGSNEEARNYCWKGQFEDKGTECPQPSSITFEYGKFCEGQGDRSEMLDIKNLIEEGLTHYEITNRSNIYFKSYGRYHSYYEKYKQWADDKRLNTMREELNNYIIWGDPDTGKTTSIYNKYGVKNCYKLKNPNKDNKNWNGYHGQKILIIDDFYSWLEFHDLLNITDNKPYRVRKLGGYEWAQWTHVFITSNQNPKKWYPNIRQKKGMTKALNAFKSRFKKCLKVTRGNTDTLVTSIDWESIRGKQNEYLDLNNVI